MVRTAEHALSISRPITNTDCNSVHDDNVTDVANESHISVNIVAEPDIVKSQTTVNIVDVSVPDIVNVSQPGSKDIADVSESDIVNVLEPVNICAKENSVSVSESQCTMQNNNINPTKLKFVSMNVKGICRG